MGAFRTDFETAKSFTHTLLPLLQRNLHANRIISFEELDNESLPRLFDRYAGIDAVSVDCKGIRGIALRVQYDIAYDTFTIRTTRSSGAQTELDKRLKAIEKGYLYPYLTCQCYCEKATKRLLSGAVCRTLDLYKYVISHKNQLEQKQRKCPEGNNFFWVSFDSLEQDYLLLRL